MQHKITQMLVKKCTFYILPVVIFYLQTSILEQGVDALFPKKQEQENPKHSFFSSKRADQVPMKNYIRF